MQNDTLLEWCFNMNMNGGLIHWMRSFLTDRPSESFDERGQLKQACFKHWGTWRLCAVINAVFHLHKWNDCSQHTVKLFKYVDDMAFVVLLLNDNAMHEEAYLGLGQVTVVQYWCQASNLEIYAAKTKELIIHTKPSWTSNICPVNSITRL